MGDPTSDFESPIWVRVHFRGGPSPNLPAFEMERDGIRNLGALGKEIGARFAAEGVRSIGQFHPPTGPVNAADLSAGAMGQGTVLTSVHAYSDAVPLQYHVDADYQSAAAAGPVTPLAVDILGEYAGDLPISSVDLQRLFDNDIWDLSEHDIARASSGFYANVAFYFSRPLVKLDYESENAFIAHHDRIIRDWLDYLLPGRFSFGRNMGDASLVKLKRPDALYSASIKKALLFRGEEKAASKSVAFEAITDLQSKLVGTAINWTQHFGTDVPFVLAYFTKGYEVGLASLWPNGVVRPLSLLVDTSTLAGAVPLLRALRTVARLWLRLEALVPVMPLSEVDVVTRDRCTLQFFHGETVVKIYNEAHGSDRVLSEINILATLSDCASIVRPLATSLFSIEFECGVRGDVAPADMPAAVQCVAGAVAFLVSKRVAHRDIRWPNVVRRHQGGWMLIDFEFAVSFDRPLPLPAVYCTGLDPATHAPEASIADATQDRVDFFGLGLLLRVVPGALGVSVQLTTPYGERLHDPATVVDAVGLALDQGHA
eukprot:c19441_g2_i3.p1 GENE.c19441_g2_i3~~c19441_g2_i3.p1  ORF type:complete len:582 (-),score=71.52 c19441_g2_i3:18-1643(-)